MEEIHAFTVAYNVGYVCWSVDRYYIRMHNIGRLCKTAGLKCINIYNDLPSKSYSLSNFNLEHSLTLVTASSHNLVIAILSLSVVNGSCLDYEVTLAWELNF